jgi:hypothetical protein
MSIAVTSKLNFVSTNYDFRHRNLRPKLFLASSNAFVP